MNAVIRIVDKILSAFLAACIGLLTFGVIVSVFLRYVFNISFVWAEELMTILFVASTFFGAALGVREKEYIAITGLFDKLPKGLTKAIRIFVFLMTIAVSVVVFNFSMIWIQRVGAVPSAATGLKSGIYYSIVPISFALTIFYSIVNIVSEFVSVAPPARFLEPTGKNHTSHSEEHA
jgi:C4-dicarboxylate transporter DctQ subunit